MSKLVAKLDPVPQQVRGRIWVAFSQQDCGVVMRLLKAGTRAKCAVCDTEVMVVRTAAAEVLLTCGEVEMVAMDGAKAQAPHTAGVASQVALVGKRYVNAADAVELLCTKGGKGALAVNGEPLSVKQTKPLPSSD